MTFRIGADTNIIISATFWGGQPKRIIELVKDGRVTLLTTVDVTRELQTTFSYIKFVERLRVINQTVEDFMVAYQKMTETVVAAEVPDIVRDKNDRIILAAAVGGKASHIVTGDKDLLTLEQYDSIPILTPTKFLAIL